MKIEKSQTIYPGKLIVIDGIDGSGKATQTKLLAERLGRAGLSVETIAFPRHGNKSASFVSEYLKGKYGRLDEVDSYQASLFYALDRYDASFQMREWLEQGKIVIADRYVTANMGHQGGKISNPLERKMFFDWLYQLEYEIFNIPRPDLNIILHLPAEISQTLAWQRKKIDWNGKTNDIHQDSLEHLKMAEQTYLEIAQNFSDIALIECVDNGRMLSREEISDLVWESIVKLFKSPAPAFASGKFSEKIKAAPKAENILKLKIEKISPWAKLPTRAYSHDAGLDLYSADYYSLIPGDCTTIKTGLKLAIPQGYAGLIWDKGGIAKSGVHSLAGVVDSGFRGEITVQLVNLSQDIYHIAPGQKIAQLLIQKVEFPEITEGKIIDNTDRNINRFSSSGLF